MANRVVIFPTKYNYLTTLFLAYTVNLSHGQKNPKKMGYEHKLSRINLGIYPELGSRDFSFDHGLNITQLIPTPPNLFH